MQDHLSYLDPLLYQILSNLLTKYRFPSLSFALFQHETLRFFSLGSVDLSKPENPPTTETLFRSASITKAFTSIMMLKLRDQGLLTLDDPIKLYLSDILPQDSSFLASFGDVTLKNLASHSAGLPQEGDFDRYDGSEMPKMKEVLSGLDLDQLFGKNEEFHYSNIGYIVLGIILEKVAKRPYNEYVVEEILKPLGMSSSGFDYNLPENQLKEAIGYLRNDDEIKEAPKISYHDCKPCGGLLTCIKDLSKYVNFLMENNNEKVLKSNKELMSPYILKPPSKNDKKIHFTFYYKLLFKNERLCNW